MKEIKFFIGKEFLLLFILLIFLIRSFVLSGQVSEMDSVNKQNGSSDSFKERTGGTYECNDGSGVLNKSPSSQ